MLHAMLGRTLLPLLALWFAGCAARTFELYPTRPPTYVAAPIADPPPSRIVLHATVGRAALERALDDAVPKTGEGTFPLLGRDRRYLWQREAFSIQFKSGRLLIDTHAKAQVEILGTVQELSIDLHIDTEPVVNAGYQARLQSPEVTVTSTDTRLRVAQSLGGALDKIKLTLQGTLRDFVYDLRPLIDETYHRLATPLSLPLGSARGCAQVSVLGLEAGPTVLADGIEKDLALVVAPSITLPCTDPGPLPPLPPLANVAFLPSGPFVVQIPIAARYEELERAMAVALPNGRLYFSKQLPDAYLEKPSIYESRDQLVVKLHLAGIAHRGNLDVPLDGDLYMVGHPAVVDNELRVPDLEPTVETSSFLLRLAASMGSDSLREQARRALRLDIGERIRAVREKMSTQLSFGNAPPGVIAASQPPAPTPALGCVRAGVSHVEVSSIHTHPGYLRLYLTLTGQAALYLPCPH